LARFAPRANFRASDRHRLLLDVLSSFFTTPGGTAGFPITRTFTAGAGQRVRVAIAAGQTVSKGWSFSIR